MVYVPSVWGRMRRILPRRSWVFAVERWASKVSRPGRSSMGAAPFDSKGLVLSPVDRYRLPSGPKTSDEPSWQQIRWVGISSMIRSDVVSSVSPTTVKRERRLTLGVTGE
jgi:hypothetical protein